MASDYSFRLTENASKDLDQILNYITFTLCNHEAAKSFYEELYKSLNEITLFPESGTPLNNPNISLEGVRKLYVKNYTVVYYPDTKNKHVVVLRII